MQFSLRNYSWKLDEHDTVRTRQLEIKHNISPLLARCMMPIMHKLYQQVLQTHPQNLQNSIPYNTFQHPSIPLSHVKKNHIFSEEKQEVLFTNTDSSTEISKTTNVDVVEDLETNSKNKMQKNIILNP